MFLWEVKKANLKVVGGWKLRKQCRPGVDTLYFHCRSRGLIPGGGTRTPHAAWWGQKKIPTPPKTNKHTKYLDGIDFGTEQYANALGIHKYRKKEV